MMNEITKKDIPKAVLETCEALAYTGGEAWLVGGCVRDILLGTSPQDWDIEVFKLEEDQLEYVLASLGRYEKVGKHFGVRKLWFKGLEIDIALPRQEKKNGVGHQGFTVVCDPNLRPKQASIRRDFTINAMMYNPMQNILLDVHGGQGDLKKRCLRHVSLAFEEDPLRPLRAMQFAARFDLTMYSTTVQICQGMLHEAGTLPKERIWQEWLKWSKSAYPSQGLKVLKNMGWDKLYPELMALQACPQDEYWHPEGNVWIHTCLVVDEAARLASERGLSEQDRVVLLFAALCHDLGKPLTTFINDVGKIVSPNHGQEGVQPSINFLQRIDAPAWLIKHVKPLVKEHVAHFSTDKITASAVKRLAARLEPSHIKMWERLTEADAGGRYPAPKSRPALPWLDLAESLDVAETKDKAIVTGKLLLRWGVEASPKMGELLRLAYESQVDGGFDDEPSAYKWLCDRNHCKS
ncbi:MAG: HD domain-containing protein [Ghiorsea sp.]|nr:HD domain-containing protein [Ghiorsea sp.]